MFFPQICIEYPKIYVITSPSHNKTQVPTFIQMRHHLFRLLAGRSLVGRCRHLAHTNARITDLTGEHELGAGEPRLHKLLPLLEPGGTDGVGASGRRLDASSLVQAHELAALVDLPLAETLLVEQTLPTRVQRAAHAAPLCLGRRVVVVVAAVLVVVIFVGVVVANHRLDAEMLGQEVPGVGGAAHHEARDAWPKARLHAVVCTQKVGVVHGPRLCEVLELVQPLLAHVEGAQQRDAAARGAAGARDYGRAQLLVDRVDARASFS